MLKVIPIMNDKVVNHTHDVVFFEYAYFRDYEHFTTVLLAKWPKANYYNFFQISLTSAKLIQSYNYYDEIKVGERKKYLLFS